MDVHNAFRRGDLTEVLKSLRALILPGMVCRLRKSLYGLKQAPCCCFAKLVTALKAFKAYFI